MHCAVIFGWRMQRRGALHRRLDGVNSCLPIPLYLSSCRRFSRVYCNSDESTPIWLLTLIGKEAALLAEVWAEESRRAHQGRPLSLLELPGTTEGHTLIYEYADRNLHTSLSTWLLPYAKRAPRLPLLQTTWHSDFRTAHRAALTGIDAHPTGNRMKTKEDGNIWFWKYFSSSSIWSASIGGNLIYKFMLIFSISCSKPLAEHFLIRIWPTFFFFG